MELKVDDKTINYISVAGEDYISITDMIKSKDGIFFCNRLAKKQKYYRIFRYLGNYITQILIMANSP